MNTKENQSDFFDQLLMLLDTAIDKMKSGDNYKAGLLVIDEWFFLPE